MATALCQQPAPSSLPSPGDLEPLLAQAAVSMPMVEGTDALVQITDHIALETLAVEVPAPYVDRLNGGTLDGSGGGVSPRGPDVGASRGGAFLDLGASQRRFVDAIDGDGGDLRASVSQIERTVRDLGECAVATAVVAAAAGSVVAEVISGAAAAAELVLTAAAVAEEGWKEQEAAEEGPKGGEQQPLAYIIARHPVWIATGFPTETEIDESIRHLDDLIEALRRVQRGLSEEGLAPGFDTKASARKWFTRNVGSVYETLPSVNGGGGPAIPMPSPAAAVKYYMGIRETWVERKRYVQSMGEGNFCSCIKEWDHAGGDVLAKLTNQSLEQDMIREASDCVTMRMQQPGCMRGEAWDRLYAPELCPTPDSVGHLYVPGTSIRVMGGRDDYIATLVSLVLKAESTIDICTCYIFPHDPAQRYILLDLLPHVARTRGVTVRLLCDLMPIESSVVKSALRPRRAVPPPGFAPPPPKRSKGGVLPLSFVDVLPPGSPPFTDGARAAPESPMAFLADVIRAAFAVPDDRFQVRWWCARDSQDKYRVKNHAKCAVFDGGSRGRSRGLALMGGSNVVPTIESGDSDLDLLVGGSDAVNRIGETFDYLWDSMCDASSVACTDIIDTTDPEPEPHEDEEPDAAGRFSRQEWTDRSCRAALVRSEPCSAGSDVIFRHVLGAIASAKTSVHMCMGHSNKPMALARALGDAVRRGVRVQLLVNSIYSCDLRVNQRDLFRSLRDLLAVAPGVEVWTTALRSRRVASGGGAATAQEEKKEEGGGSPVLGGEDQEAPPFLHSKYTVVDGRWVAVGSWNVWTRSAFYEIEHELLIESDAIARKLEDKFEREKAATSVLLTTPEECSLWCPTGCKLCQPFGPFYM